MTLVEDTTASAPPRQARYEPLSAEFLADPYPVYQRLREDRPVYWDRRFGWIVSRYADVAAALLTPGLSVQRPLPDDQIPTHLQPIADKVREVRAMQSRWLLFNDPPRHTRLRGLVESAFGRLQIETLRARIRQLVDELLQPLGASGQMDVVADLAYPLPSTIITELLGVPIPDRDALREWSHNIVGASILSIPTIERAWTSQRALIAYLEELISDRRELPGEDLLSRLVVGEQSGLLTHEEVVGTAVLFLFVGHETTTNLIANGTLALLRCPEERRRLREHPALITTAVEELLRFDSPVHVAYRRAIQNFELAGVRIARGDHMLLLIGSANRDPERFLNPESLELARQPNRHLSFSAGAHYCLGASLGRIEAQLAIGALFTRFPNIHLVDQRPLVFRPDILLRGLESLPVALA